jgi:hypothetical protein
VWITGRVPWRFWEDRLNRRSYMLWLGHELRFRRMADWYCLTIRDIKRNHGRRLLDYWQPALVEGLKECFPDYEWQEWQFDQVPTGFWEVAVNRRRYLHWLGHRLGFRRAKDWYRICSEDFAAHHGSTLLRKYGSFYDVMREHLPQLDWDQLDHGKPIDIEQILRWADAFYETRNEWPTLESGPVPGTNMTWLAVDCCLKKGHRGLPGGSSLPQLLEECRGVRPGRTAPPLSEKQILVWADAYFAAHGRWPKRTSGLIPGQRDTWRGVEDSLRRGERGFAGGSSLAQFLAQHRGARTRSCLPVLEVRRILAWAKSHVRATGRWPTHLSGSIPQSRGETWAIVEHALVRGSRGLPGGSSLHRLFTEHGLKGRASAATARA